MNLIKHILLPVIFASAISGTALAIDPFPTGGGDAPPPPPNRTPVPQCNEYYYENSWDSQTGACVVHMYDSLTYVEITGSPFNAGTTSNEQDCLDTPPNSVSCPVHISDPWLDPWIP